MTQKTKENPWTMDVRVRERNLKSGALTEKDLEKNLAALPDLSDQAESFVALQPALTHPVEVASAPDLDDEDEDEDEDDDVDDAEPAPAPVAPAVDAGGEGTP